MIFKQIREKLISQDTTKLDKKMGYNNYKNFEKTLKNFLSSKSLYDWLENGHYDYVNTSYDFFIKLSSELDIDTKKHLKQKELLKNEILRFKNSYLFINTNFHRTSEPIFALAAMESLRRIDLSNREDFYFKSTDEILKMISQEIKKHYQERDSLPLWGPIVNYQVHLEGDIYVFDVNGVFQKDLKVSENKAFLTI